MAQFLFGWLFKCCSIGSVALFDGFTLKEQLPQTLPFKVIPPDFTVTVPLDSNLRDEDAWSLKGVRKSGPKRECPL